jgi:hypothetical protein
MINWWLEERLAQIEMHDRLCEAERDRLVREAMGAAACRTGLLSLVVAWLSGRFLVLTRRRQYRSCADAGLGQSCGSQAV